MGTAPAWRVPAGCWQQRGREGGLLCFCLLWFVTKKIRRNNCRNVSVSSRCLSVSLSCWGRTSPMCWGDGSAALSYLPPRGLQDHGNAVCYRKRGWNTPRVGTMQACPCPISGRSLLIAAGDRTDVFARGRFERSFSAAWNRARTNPTLCGD